VRILSQTVSSSQCERNWTTFSLIHTKPRNRLTMDKLRRLVFVHYNMRLRERHLRRTNDQDQLIDLDAIFHEEDPLTPWIREQEQSLLDDQDNPWLDEALGNESSNQHSNTSDSPTNDSGGGGGGGGGREEQWGQHMGDTSNTEFHLGIGIGRDDYDYVPSTYHDGTFQYGQFGDDHDRSTYRDDQSHIDEGYNRDLDGVPGHSGGSTPIFPIDPRCTYNPYGYSTSIGYGESQSSEVEHEQSSPFDNMMSSLFGHSGIQHLYPAQYPRHDDEDTSDSIFHDPPRHSTWY
jgi:hypothetical protein